MFLDFSCLYIPVRMNISIVYDARTSMKFTINAKTLNTLICLVYLQVGGCPEYGEKHDWGPSIVAYILISAASR